MNRNSKISAFVAYLLPIVGWSYVFLFRRKDKFAVFHAKQALVLTALAVGVPIGWAVLSWFLLWIPTAGPLVAVPGFTMVILVYIAVALLWIVGMWYAWQDRPKGLPVVGNWAQRIPGG